MEVCAEGNGGALWEMLRQIWNREGIPENWRKGVICPIYKRGDKGAVKSYRGVTLMDTAYKIYAGILDERLKVEIKDKLAENKQLSGERGKLYVCFVDLKSAFDRVNRKKLGEMRRMGVNEKLTRRIEEIYEETKNVVRIRNNYTEEFWTRNVELELSTKKTKVIVFEKRRNKRRQMKWRWGEHELEEVDEIRYLGYILQKNGSDEKHIQGWKRRAAIAMKKIWSVGGKIFKRDYKRRMRMFGALVECSAVWSAGVVMEHRRETGQGKKEIREMAARLRRNNANNYILREECQIEEIKEKTLKRAVRCEKKALESKKELVKEGMD
ncbi:uncharacterized protein LOC117212779 [Bombus bifarius]|uniref:Uncharacterized protein LOC117212779 n=1 Tax=Bombus bifarius TaxID=103933 RepID=A0A6P8NGQ8_9HYME|nr:uncharacterized protein LOC117212779 [Bombus bifarius]